MAFHVITRHRSRMHYERGLVAESVFRRTIKTDDEYTPRFELASFEIIIEYVRKGQLDGKRRYESVTCSFTGKSLGARASSGHTGNAPVDFSTFTNRVPVIYQHTRYLWHATNNMRMNPITQKGLLVGGTRRNGRHVMFFSIMDPLSTASRGANPALGRPTRAARISVGNAIFAPYPMHRGSYVQD